MPCRVKIDTASPVTLVSNAFVAHHNLPTFDGPTKHLTGFTGAPGGSTTASTYCPVTLQLQEQSLAASFLVCDLSGDSDLLLGTDSFKVANLVPEELSLSPRLASPAARSYAISATVASTTFRAPTPHPDFPHTERKKLLSEFSDLFGDVDVHGMPTPVYMHRIRLVDNAEPFRQKERRVQPRFKRQLAEWLDDALSRGIISHSRSSFSSPLHIVPKANGTIRPCGDYRRLNAITKADVYPPPLVDDIFDKLEGATIYTVIDLTSAFHNVLIHPDDRDYTAFSANGGLYHYNCLPFGLQSSPASFMRFLSLVLDGLDVPIGPYFDDLIIGSRTVAEHSDHVRKLLQRLREHNIRINEDKIRVGYSHVAALGFLLGPSSIAPLDKKLYKLQDYPVPTTTTQLRSFVGLANFYRRFVKGFSALARPLTKRCTEATAFEWTTEMDNAFHAIIDALCQQPVLNIPDFERDFVLRTDASDFATGAVLEQDGRPVGFDSAVLNKHELNYTVREKELLAIVRAFQRWGYYLAYATTTVYTDHESLTSILQPKREILLPKERRLLRWTEFLSNFRMEIRYVPGKVNDVADALSRLPGDDAAAPAAVAAVTTRGRSRRATRQQSPSAAVPPSPAPPQPSSASSILPASTASPSLSASADHTSSDTLSPASPPAPSLAPTSSRPTSSVTPQPATSPTALPDSSMPSPLPATSMADANAPAASSTTTTATATTTSATTTPPATTTATTDLRHSATTATTATASPTPLPLRLSEATLAQIRDAYSEDPHFADILAALRANKPAPASGPLRLQLECYCLRDGLLYRTNPEQGAYVLCLPDCAARAEILEHIHAVELCHRAAQATLVYFSSRFYAPRARSLVTRFCRSCPHCLAAKPQHFTYGVLQPLPAPSRPFEDMSLDFFEWSPSPSGLNFCLLVTDRFSKFIFLIPCNKTCTAAQAAALFVTYVLPVSSWPRTLVSDRDPRFTADVWKSLFRIAGTKLQFSTPNSPQTDGASERSVKTVKEALRAGEHLNADWTLRLALVANAFNSVVHEVTGQPPCLLALARQPRSLFPSALPPADNQPSVMNEIYAAARRSIEDARAAAAKHYDVHRRPPPALEPGHRVYARTSALGKTVRDRHALRRCASALPRFTGAFDIVKGLFHNTIVIAVPESISDTMTKRINVRDIKLTDDDAELYAPGPVGHEHGEPLYAIDFIVDDAILDGDRHTSLYVKWRGYNIPEWTDIANFRHLPILLKKYFTAAGRKVPRK